MRTQPLAGSILWMLQRAYKDDPKKLENKLKEITEGCFYRDSTYTWNELNRTHEIGPNRSSHPINDIEREKKENSPTLKRDFFRWISTLNSMFGISIEDLTFEHTREIVERIEASHAKTSKTRVLSLEGFDKKSDDYHSEKKSDYIGAQMEFLGGVKTDLVVYDYLERQNPDIADYLEAHGEFFNAIEEKLEEQPFLYRRYLALPLRIRGKTPLELKEEELKMLVVKFSSVYLFKHICRCHKMDPKFGNKKKHLGFYMIANPTRTSHYAISNEGEACLSEYCRFNETLACKPDILYIENASESSSFEKITTRYSEELKDLKKRSVKFTLTGVSEILETLLQEIEDKLRPEGLAQLDDDVINLYEARKRILKSKQDCFNKLFTENHKEF